MNRDTLLEFFWYSDGMRPAGSSEPGDANGVYLKVSDVEALLDAQAAELALVREVLNTDLKAAQDRVLTLELEVIEAKRLADASHNTANHNFSVACTLEAEKKRQLEMLISIRTMADEATGIDRADGNDRESGAIGAVRHLIARWKKQQDFLKQIAADAGNLTWRQRVANELLKG